MTENLINIQLKQKKFFLTGKTKDNQFRIDNLRKLFDLIKKNESKILNALYEDLHKSETEAYTSEIAYVLKEIKLTVKNLKKWSKTKKVSTPIFNQPGRSYLKYEPYGNVLIIGPWNYPFMLVVSPLLAAMSAGNCIIVKPSEISANTSKLIEDLINQNFPAEYLHAVQGGAEVSQELINENTDYVFFTGSPFVGKKIMQFAAKHLIPVTLELGGKNPCIIDKNCDLEVTANRIVWGKFFNAGQTCIAPDYLLVHKDIETQFLDALKLSIEKFYPNINKNNKDYAHIINDKHFDRLSELLTNGKTLTGGEKDKNSLYIAPTVLKDVENNSPIMQDEIFGPILPVMFYNSLDEVISNLNKQAKPLALYFFSKSDDNINKIINETSSGSVCINGTIHTIISNKLPFGGVGKSGMGAYHGRAGFETFSHKKSIIKKSILFDFKVIYPPYKTKLSLLKKIY